MRGSVGPPAAAAAVVVVVEVEEREVLVDCLESLRGIFWGWWRGWFGSGRFGARLCAWKRAQDKIVRGLRIGGDGVGQGTWLVFRSIYLDQKISIGTWEKGAG